LNASWFGLTNSLSAIVCDLLDEGPGGGGGGGGLYDWLLVVFDPLNLAAAKLRKALRVHGSPRCSLSDDKNRSSALQDFSLVGCQSHL
jgi:hypothetical protein